MFFWQNSTGDINEFLKKSSQVKFTDVQFLEREIYNWKLSNERKNMVIGEKYYKGEHDILNRRRTVIGSDGLLVEVLNLPNNKIVDNQYSKMVDQKTNYLLGKPFSISTDNKQYEDVLNTVFNKKMYRTLKNLALDVLNGGIAWLHPYYDTEGHLAFKKFEPYEILPFWADTEHTRLDLAVRVFEVEAYDGYRHETVEKVEVYDANGIERYIYRNNTLIPDVETPSSTHMTFINADGSETPMNWAKIPIIAFKYNHKEIPLITRLKSLQDGINQMLSDFQNNMQEDSRNTILVIKNLDGTDLAEFRHNLATYGAVKVKTVDGAVGEVDTLKVEVNNENYKAILDLLKNALIENARGYDAKDEKMSGNPNQMNIQSMYSDIDLDANAMETEFQASIENMLWFINTHFINTGQGDFSNEKVDFIFNRDILINESEVIENCQKSTGILSSQTIVSQHPWVIDVDAEIDRLAEEKQDMILDYTTAFPKQNMNGGVKDGDNTE